MDRLTYVTEDGTVLFSHNGKYAEIMNIVDMGDTEYLLKIAEVLADTEDKVMAYKKEYDGICAELNAYENTRLTPGQIAEQTQDLKMAFSKIDDYKKRISDGSLIWLPCSIGDTVYVLAECSHIPHVLDGDYETATGYYCPYELNDKCPHDTDGCERVETVTAIFEDTVQSFQIDENRIMIVTENCRAFQELGEYIFLTREDAEAQLAKEIDDCNETDEILEEFMRDGDANENERL